MQKLAWQESVHICVWSKGEQNSVSQDDAALKAIQ